MQQVNLFSSIELEDSTLVIPEIHKAIKAGNIESFTNLVSPETINQKDKDGITPLMVACITGSFEFVSILCELNINIDDKCTKKGYTAFMYSCFGRNLDIIKTLISKKCNLSTIDISGDDICDLGLLSPILTLIQNATSVSTNLVKCKQCNIQFKNEGGWSPEGNICSNCFDHDLFGSPKPIISAEELKKINKNKRVRSTQGTPSSLNPSPTNIQSSSTSFYMCPQCKNRVDTSVRICSCGRKSPFSR